MKNKKIKCLILIVALFITRSQLYVFSETTSSGNNNDQVISGEPPQEGTITLDGQIGEWDPTDSGAPNFNQGGLEIEGTKPTEGQYYTISVTVPLSMEFIVLPRNQSAFGQFYSPEYTITNNGSKTLEVRIDTFEQNRTTPISDDETQLHVSKVLDGDGITQMELNLSVLDKFNSITKNIDLTKLSPSNSEPSSNLTDDEKTLYELTANESKSFKFSSDRWELPWFESNKKSARSNFTAGFEFSIKK